MERFLVSLLCVVMVVCFMPAMAFADGNDPDYSQYSAEGTVFTIADAADLLGFANIANGTSANGKSLPTRDVLIIRRCATSADAQTAEA